jgi:GNAT superfamily N-acetyltransferase
MSLATDLALRDARIDDLPAIAAQREAAGWGVHEWALRAVIGSPHARCVVVEDGDGAIIGVGSGAAYPPIGFVGNMLVAESHRRRGIGSHVLRTVVEYLRRAGATRVELFATAAGRPLYERHGFTPSGPSAMAALPRGAGVADTSVQVTEATPGDLAEVAAYDTPRFGGDRSWLLAILAREPGHPLLVARRGDSVVGHAWLRPDADRIGPFAADGPTVAAALLGAAFERRPGLDVLSTNLPMANQPAVRWLTGIGVELEPWEGRMALGPDVPRSIDAMYGNAVGALG